ncbi:MAG: hypothetical protein AAF736_10480, partial [Pseudomonadota bacterium]
KRIRVPAKTRGIVFDDDKLTSVLGIAQFYVGSTLGEPSPTAQIHMERAVAAVGAAEADYAEFVRETLEPFASTAGQTPLGLFSGGAR